MQISQLKKLVDHLRSGKEDSHDSKKKPPLEWAMSYEEVHEHLEKERERNRNLIDELKQVRTAKVNYVYV